MQESNTQNETVNETNITNIRPSQEQYDETIKTLVKAMQRLNRWDGMEYTHIFATPFEWMGDTFETMTFDFTLLTGRESAAAAADARRMGLILQLQARDYPQEYLASVAARCCTTKPSLGGKLGLDAFLAMSLQDFLRICYQVRLFLLRAGL